MQGTNVVKDAWEFKVNVRPAVDLFRVHIVPGKWKIKDYSMEISLSLISFNTLLIVLSVFNSLVASNNFTKRRLLKSGFPREAEILFWQSWADKSISLVLQRRHSHGKHGWHWPSAFPIRGSPCCRSRDSHCSDVQWTEIEQARYCRLEICYGAWKVSQRKVHATPISVYFTFCSRALNCGVSALLLNGNESTGILGTPSILVPYSVLLQPSVPTNQNLSTNTARSVSVLPSSSSVNLK
jgi:hypothetical protein